MSEKGYNQEEILQKLHEVETLLSRGQTKQQIAHAFGISEETLNLWRKEYGRIPTDQTNRLNDLEQEDVYAQRRMYHLAKWNEFFRARGAIGSDTSLDSTEELMFQMKSILQDMAADKQSVLLASDSKSDSMPLAETPTTPQTNDSKSDSMSTEMSMPPWDNSNNMAFLSLLLRSWWILLLTTVVAAGAAYFYADSSKPIYQARSTYLIVPNEDLGDSETLSSLNPLNEFRATYAEILQSSQIYDLAVADMELENVSQYRRRAIVIPESNVLQLTITGPLPESTAELANRIGEEAMEYSGQIYRVYDVLILDLARPPDSPTNSSPIQMSIIAGFLGMGLGLALVFLRWQLETFLRDLSDTA